MRGQREHICAYIRVKLVSRPVEAQDKSARLVERWENAVVVGPRARRGERLVATRRSHGTLQLSLNGIGGWDGHVKVQRWEKLTGSPGGAGACYKGEKAKRGALDRGKHIVHATGR